MNLWWYVKAGSIVDTSYNETTGRLYQSLRFALMENESCRFYKLSTTTEAIKQTGRVGWVEDQCQSEKALLIVFLSRFKWACDGLIQATGCALTPSVQLAMISSNTA